MMSRDFTSGILSESSLTVTPSLTFILRSGPL